VVLAGGTGKDGEGEPRYKPAHLLDLKNITTGKTLFLTVGKNRIQTDRVTIGLQVWWHTDHDRSRMLRYDR
jgi:hypothetical protein